MLDAGRAPQLIAGLSVFFDHADARRRYVLPALPRLVVDPEPMLSLALFRGGSGGAGTSGESGDATGATAGGLLQLEATLAPLPEQLREVEQRLAADGPAPALARPDVRSGSVRVEGWLAVEELAPELLVVGVPSLVGDPSALISARLDSAGAALAVRSLSKDALPLVLLFELELLGLAGPLGVVAEARLQALHDRLSLEGALTTPYGRARLAKTWESAARDNLIQVHVLDESGDVEGRRAEALRRVGEDLIARMFSPLPPESRGDLLGNDKVAPFELSFRLRARREELATSSRWDFRERCAIPLRHHAAASLVGLLGGRDPERCIRFVDLALQAREIVLRVEPELTKLGLADVVVDLRAELNGPVEHSCSLRDAAPEARYVAARGSRYQYRVTAHCDPSRVRAADAVSDWLDAETDLIVVSGRRLFPPRWLTVILGRGELDWLDHIEVVLQAPNQPPRSLRLSADAPSTEQFFPLLGDAPVELRAEFCGRANQPSRSVPALPVRSELYVLDSPFAESLDVLVVPVWRSGVVSLSLTLRAEHEGFAHEVTLDWQAPESTPVRAALRRLVGSPRQYRYRMELVHDDGTLEQLPWLEGKASALVAVADGAFHVDSVQVVLLGGGPAARGCYAVELTLQAGEQAQRVVLEGEQDSANLSLASPDGAPAPSVLVREFLDSGEVRTRRFDNPGPILVLDSAPATAS